MAKINFDKIEEELDLVVPNIYRMFIEAVNSKGLNLKKYGIYSNTKEVIKGNLELRVSLSDSNPQWKDNYFDFGVGDGCGNYFFLEGTNEEDIVQLWAHDPEGIEEVGSATEFFMALLAEVEAEFKGADQYRFQGNMSC